LEETRRADLLAHVLDASAPEARARAMQRAVEQTLSQIGAGDRPRLLVLNKADLLDEAAREELRLCHPDAVLVSGRTGEGLAALTERIEHELAHTARRVDLLVPYAEAARRSWLISPPSSRMAFLACSATSPASPASPSAGYVSQASRGYSAVRRENRW